MMVKMYFCLLVACLIIVSCSPTKRFNRLVERHPYLLTKDTITQIDTIKIQVPVTKADSVMKLDSFLVELHDTIVIEKERLKIELFKVRDSIIINGKCDTIYLDKVVIRKVPVKVFVKPEKKLRLKDWALLVAGIFILCLLVLIVLKFVQLLK